MLAVLLFEKGQKLCSIPQIMPNIMLAQSARAYSVCSISNTCGCTVEEHKIKIANSILCRPNCHHFFVDSSLSGAYAGGGGGVHWEKSSAQKCSKEERKFRPDMWAKKNVHVPLRYDKIKTKKVGRKEDVSKRKG